MYSYKIPHGIMFHHFHHDGNCPTGQGSITSAGFDQILHHIGVNNIISPEEWICKLNDNKLKGNDICITFDDALKSQYDIALPVLDKYNLKAFWFIYSSVFNGILEKFELYRKFRTAYFNGFDEYYNTFINLYNRLGFPSLEDNIQLSTKIKYLKKLCPFYSNNDVHYRVIRNYLLNREEYEMLVDTLIEEKGTNLSGLADGLWLTNLHIKKLNNKGHNIGMHAYNHPYSLSEMSYSAQYDQLTNNYVHISNVIGRNPVSMSYPNNSYNDDTIKILNELNISCAFRTDLEPLIQKSNIDSRLTIPRIDHVIIAQELNIK